MILEGAYELRTARECRRLKEKENASFQKLADALEDCQDAFKSQDEQDVEDALQKVERAREAYEAVKTELWRVAQSLMDFASDALEKGECTEEPWSIT